ncbi:MAG: T9SS type A sorting domain-containing protein [Bacteroidota bacterium]
MKRFFLFLPVLGLSLTTYSQVNKFQITYGTTGSDWGKAAPTSDGGYIIIMNDGTNPSQRDISIVKLDSIGNITWSKTYGNPANTDDAWIRVIEAHNGGFLVAGSLDALSPNPVPVWIRIDSGGDTVWVKRNLFSSFNIVKTLDGGYAAVGTNFIKTDSSGNIQWSKIYNGGCCSGYGQQTADSGYIILDLTMQYASGGPLDRDLRLVKTDPAGNVQWIKVFGRPSTLENPAKVVQTTDGGYLVLANTGLSNQPQTYDLMLIKTDGSGNLQWAKNYGGSDYEQGIDLKVTGAIGYIVTGYTIGFEGPQQNSNRSFLMRTDGSGTPVWTKMYGDFATNPINSYDEAAYVAYTNDGGFLMSGTTESFGSGSRDVWLVKTDPIGTSGCNEIVNNPAVTLPSLSLSSGGYDSVVYYTSSPHTVAIGTWMPVKTILCLNGSLNGQNEYTNAGSLPPYPNPNTGIFSLKADNGKLEIYNSLGKIIYQTEITGLEEIDIQNVSNGIYILKLTEGNQMYFWKMIIH